MPQVAFFDSGVKKDGPPRVLGCEIQQNSPTYYKHPIIYVENRLVNPLIVALAMVPDVVTRLASYPPIQEDIIDEIYTKLGID